MGTREKREDVSRVTREVGAPRYRPGEVLAVVLELRVGVGGDSSRQTVQRETSWQDPVSTKAAVVNRSVANWSDCLGVPAAYPGPAYSGG